MHFHPIFLPRDDRVADVVLGDGGRGEIGGGGGRGGGGWLGR